MSSERGFLISFVAVIAIATAMITFFQRPQPVIRFYDGNLTHRKLPCLSLRISPPHSVFEKTLRKAYTFDATCPYRLSVAFKGGIVCNSSYNAEQKCVEGMPHAFLRMDVQRGFRTLYSYYVDMEGNVDTHDVRRAFERVKTDILGR